MSSSRTVLDWRARVHWETDGDYGELGLNQDLVRWEIG